MKNFSSSSLSGLLGKGSNHSRKSIGGNSVEDAGAPITDFIQRKRRTKPRDPAAQGARSSSHGDLGDLARAKDSSGSMASLRMPRNIRKDLKNKQKNGQGKDDPAVASFLDGMKKKKTRDRAAMGLDDMGVHLQDTDHAAKIEDKPHKGKHHHSEKQKKKLEDKDLDKVYKLVTKMKESGNDDLLQDFLDKQVGIKRRSKSKSRSNNEASTDNGPAPPVGEIVIA